MAQQGYGPPSLPVGTEVSAKYRGAFCEAKVKTVSKIVKCKVQIKDSQISICVADDEIKGPAKLGAVVEVKHPNTNQPVEATILKLIDHSLYTVVFDDGDERTLRRTQLCLKGDKHFIESETLDNLPLSHPEHFGTPVLSNKKGKKKTDEDDDEDDSEEESPRRAMYRGRHQELVGKLFLVDLPHRKGSAIPALVVLPDSNSISEVKKSDQILVRSFKDSKYMTVTRKHLKEFSRTFAIKNEDKTMRTAFEKALLYFDTKELPVGWKRDDMLGSDLDEDDVLEDNEYASEDEPYEEKDRFVAQLYKFMDDRGTPINKGPCIGNKDLNLYKLFKIVQNLGGYNKVTKEMKWHVVYSKMGLPSLHQNPAHQVKSAYKKYLDAYEAFYRKLGNAMGTQSRPGRARQNSGRSILNYRSREKSPRLPKITEKKVEQEPLKPKTEVAEKSEDSQDSASVASTEENDLVPRRAMQRRERVQVTKERDESKEKEKKEDVPKGKDKKDEVKTKKEEAPGIAKTKKEEMSTPVSKGKKEDFASKVKNEDSVVKKEERKSVRKLVKTEEEKDEKIEKKPVRTIRKEKDEIPAPDSTKKRLTRRKLLKNEDELKDEVPEDKKEQVKKAVPKDVRVTTVEKKEKEIPRTLERRDSKTIEKKVGVKVPDIKVAEKKTVVKGVEDKKPVKRERKVKETEKDEDKSEGEVEEESNEELKQERPSSPKIEYPIGTKLRVKYGKGKNQKMYIAKVIDTVVEGPHRTYLVHYAGWNMRYDEWIRGDRVSSILDKAASVDKPENPKRTDIPKAPGLKVHKPLSNSLKRLTSHRTPMLTKKSNQIFRTPKVLTAKTRATRSSSSETSSGSPTLSSEKRTTRRRSVVGDVGVEKSEENQQTEENEDASMTEDNTDEKPHIGIKDGEEDSQLVDVEDEDQEEEEEEDDTEEKNEMDTSLEDDGEEVEETVEDTEEKMNTEHEDMVKAEQVKDEPEDSEVKEEVRESEIAEEDVKNVIEEEVEEEEEEESVEKSGDSNEVFSPIHKVEKASVMVAEVKTADSIITSVLVEDTVKEDDSDGEIKPDVGIVASSSQENEKEEKAEEEDCIKSDPDREDDTHSLEMELKQNVQSTDITKKIDEPDAEEEEENVCDQSIPLLKKMDVDVDRREVDKTKSGKSRKKEAGKDSKKLNKSTSDASQVSIEIPTLEPIMKSVDPVIVKSSPSPYDFDETENESQWQPEISKKWDTGTTEQSSHSKESTPVAGDVMDKEKKKVKKKTKKKFSTPQFVSDSKSEDASNSSLPIVESVYNAAELHLNEEDKLSSEKQSQKKKGRKRKDMNAEQPRPEVIEQYESTVNSVVEAVKHSLREESPEREINKPTPKKRRLKRVSESDKKEPGRVLKTERRRGLRDSQDTVEALNVEGSKGKTVIHDKSLLENVSMLTASKLKQPSSEAVNSSNTADKMETKFSNSGIEIEESVANGTQPFIPQLSEERNNSGAVHYENTPPTTPEHEEGEACATSSQQPPCASPCSDDLTLKTESLKDGSLSSSSSISLPASSSNVAPVKSNSDSPSDNDVGSLTSNENLDTALTTNQGSESSGTEQDVIQSRKRKPVEEPVAVTSVAKKKKRVHGTRSRTAKKSPKYISTDSVSYQTRMSDSHVSSSASSNHYLESPLSRLADLTKSPRPSKYNFNADLGEYLEGEERCNFLISKMKEIKTIYMNLKSEVASIDRRRKRIRRKERESSQASPSERDGVR